MMAVIKGTAPVGAERPDELPLYRRLSDGLRADIAAGRVLPGERVPSERELAARHAVSVNTARRVLDELAAAGVVERRHGTGTFVREGRRRPVGALVGVVVPSVTSFFGEIIRGIEDELREAGHRPVLYSSNYDRVREQHYLSRLDEQRLDGLLIAPSIHGRDPSDYLALLRRVRRRLPTVFVERRILEDDAEFVSSDPVAGAALAVRHLAALGHRRIALIGPTRSAPAASIYEGYRKGLAEAGLAEDPALVKRHREWGRRGADDDVDTAALVSLPEPPTGILCMGDQYAFRVYYVLRRLGRRIPEDVALVAYDDVVAHLLEVPLTAVSPPKYEVGRRAAALLVRRLDEGTAPPIHQVLLKPQLAVRGTCGGLPDASADGAPAHTLAAATDAAGG